MDMSIYNYITCMYWNNDLCLLIWECIAILTVCIKTMIFLHWYDSIKPYWLGCMYKNYDLHISVLLYTAISAELDMTILHYTRGDSSCLCHCMLHTRVVVAASRPDQLELAPHSIHFPPRCDVRSMQMQKKKILESTTSKRISFKAKNKKKLH